MALDDFKGRDWATLTDAEKQRAVLIIAGWREPTSEEVAGDDITSMFKITGWWIRPGGTLDTDEWYWCDDIPNPLTDPGAAMEVFKAKAEEYQLFLSWSGNQDRAFGWECCYTRSAMARPFANYEVYADSPEEAICEAVYLAWQARQQ